MNVLYFLLPLSILLLAFITGAFIWAVKSKQFDDMEGPAYRILYDGEDTDFYRLNEKEKELAEKEKKLKDKEEGK